MGAPKWELVTASEASAKLDKAEVLRIEETARMHVTGGTLYRHQTVLLWLTGKTPPSVSTSLVFVPEGGR